MGGILAFLSDYPGPTIIVVLLAALAAMVMKLRREQAKAATEERAREIGQAQDREDGRRQEDDKVREEMKGLDGQVQEAKRDGAAARDRQTEPHQRVKERFDKYNRDQ